jgi:hypothetical protein
MDHRKVIENTKPNRKPTLTHRLVHRNRPREMFKIMYVMSGKESNKKSKINKCQQMSELFEFVSENKFYRCISMLLATLTTLIDSSWEMPPHP